MSSTSSSECDSGECCYYAYSQDRTYGRNVDYGRTPFYPTMGQPLVYYTHVQQPSIRRQRSRESSKRNPNCFVKAFQWYTQELVPVQQRCSHEDFSHNMNGFASWLDSKYDKFLKEGDLGRSMVHLKLKQTSELEADTIPQNDEYTQCTKNKFKRMKGPWKKRRRQRSKENGDTIEKSTLSFEYILRPKDLGHPPSESCHGSPTNYNPSIATVNKSSSKHSLTNVRKDKNNNNDSPDVVIVHDGSKNRQKEQQQAQDVKPIISPSKLGNRNVIARGSRPLDVACQCPEEILINAEAGTQYDNKASLPVESKQNSSTKVQKKRPHEKFHEEYFYSSCMCSNEHYVFCIDSNKQYQKQNKDESQNIGGHETENQKDSAQTSQTKTVIKSTCCNQKHQETLTTEPCKVSVNDEVQTSDIPISLDKNTVNYPFFMKIVCADKLNNECKACHLLN